MPDYAKIVRRRMRPEIFERDGNRCVYCGLDDFLVLDHVIPKSLGGQDTRENLVTCCTDCNSRKGTKSLDELGWEICRS